MKKLFIIISVLGLIIGCSKNETVQQDIGTNNAIPDQQVVSEEDQLELAEDKVIMSDLPSTEVILNLSGNANMKDFYEFIENVNMGNADRISITAYTKEGDPIYRTIEYDGEVMTYTYDNSEDKFGGDNIGVKTDTCQVIDAEQEGLNSQYYLSSCTTNDESYFIVSVPLSESFEEGSDEGQNEVNQPVVEQNKVGEYDYVPIMFTPITQLEDDLWEVKDLSNDQTLIIRVLTPNAAPTMDVDSRYAAPSTTEYDKLLDKEVYIVEGDYIQPLDIEGE